MNIAGSFSILSSSPSQKVVGLVKSALEEHGLECDISHQDDRVTLTISHAGEADFFRIVAVINRRDKNRVSAKITREVLSARPTDKPRMYAEYGSTECPATGNSTELANKIIASTLMLAGVSQQRSYYPVTPGAPPQAKPMVWDF